jgi:hypothetical protein
MESGLKRPSQPLPKYPQGDRSLPRYEPATEKKIVNDTPKRPRDRQIISHIDCND